ncbi:CidA/LrgA family protein [Viridibacillus sp. NPDC096237]|uniref:CidA/LrgA family protein n=1 Tax=Viridibacillus sp. NPDC096237 TaxID=3390721 RepID=UPI003D057051
MQSKVGKLKLVKHKNGNYKIAIKNAQVNDLEINETVVNEQEMKEQEVKESEKSEVEVRKMEIKDLSTTQMDSTQLKQKNVKKIKILEQRSIKWMRIILQMVVLYIFSFVGTTIVNLLGVKFPGSIVGLLILFALLLSNVMPVSLIEEGAGFMLAVLPLFFVPATVGAIKYPELLSLHGILLLLTVISSTIFTIIVSGRISIFLEKKEKVESEEMKEGVK